MSNEQSPSAPIPAGIPNLKEAFARTAAPKRPVTDLRADTPPATTEPAPSPRVPESKQLADEKTPVRRTLFVAEDLADAIALRCAREHINRTVLVLAALNATHKRLPELVAQDAAEPGPASPDDLFPIPTRQRPRNTHQVPIRPTASQVKDIDDLVAKCGARDRSHMLSVALREYLRDDL